VDDGVIFPLVCFALMIVVMALVLWNEWR